MNRRDFLISTAKISGIIGLLSIGLSLNDAEAWYNHATGKKILSEANGTIGSTNDTSPANRVYTGYEYHDKFTTGTAGNVRHGHARITNDGSSITLCMALRDLSGNLLLSGTQAISHSGTAWVNIDMGSSYTLVAATQYYLTIQSNTTFSAGNGIRLDNAGDGFFYDAHAYNCSFDPMNAEETSDGAGLDFVLYFDNSSGDPT